MCVCWGIGWCHNLPDNRSIKLYCSGCHGSPGGHGPLRKVGKWCVLCLFYALRPLFSGMIGLALNVNGFFFKVFWSFFFCQGSAGIVS